MRKKRGKEERKVRGNGKPKPGPEIR